MKTWRAWLVVALGLIAACRRPDGETASVQQSALTAEMCDYFEVGGKIQICHLTSRTDHPYTVLQVSDQACVHAHASHPGDYVALADVTCRGKGCLPAGAPCDAVRPCCGLFTCIGGTCECGSGLTTCGDVCTDMTSDVSNCGACGNACPAGAECENGACVCPPGYADCDIACVNLTNDSDNCGTCGTVCPFGKICIDSVCSCGSATNCDGTCIDTTTDPNNCGACGAVCPASFSCKAGACVSPDTCTIASACDPGTGQCVFTPQPDGTPCEHFGTCTAGDSCQAGVCAAGPIEQVVTTGSTTIYTCPPTTTAVDGYVHFACGFPGTFEPNNVFTGQVFLVSHLDRFFADFDVHTLPDGSFQLSCFYATADGTGIGGIYAMRAPGGTCVASGPDTITCAN